MKNVCADPFCSPRTLLPHTYKGWQAPLEHNVSNTLLQITVTTELLCGKLPYPLGSKIMKGNKETTKTHTHIAFCDLFARLIKFGSTMEYSAALNKITWLILSIASSTSIWFDQTWFDDSNCRSNLVRFCICIGLRMLQVIPFSVFFTKPRCRHVLSFFASISLLSHKSHKSGKFIEFLDFGHQASHLCLYQASPLGLSA